MMQKFTKFLFLMALLAYGSSLSAQELTVLWPPSDDPAAIANSEFDGGLNDWTTESIFNSDSVENNNSIWVWESDGLADGGFFYGTRGPIESPSAANGAIVFDSDFYDNGGEDPFANGFGTGPAPCSVLGDPGGATDGLGHRGEITSPSIDCSDFDQVSLRFNQYFRRFSPTTAIVAVSNDGGENFTEFTVNQDVEVNAETPATSQVLLDISSVAANQADVQIRFAYQGCYYYWIIDDVQLIEPPAIDAGIGDFFYGVNFATPMSQITDDSVGFSADLSNANTPLQNTVLRVEVQDLDTAGNVEAVLHSEDLNIGVLDGGIVDSTFEFTQLWAPGMLEQGLYQIEYSLTADNLGEDFDPSDNTVSNVFQVTDNLYSKENRITANFRPGSGGEYATGNMYRTSNTWENGFWSATQAFFGGATAASGADGPMAGKSVNIYLMKVQDGVAPAFAAEDFDVNGGFLENPALEIVGFVDYTFVETGNNETATVTLLDFNTFEETVRLDPDSYYFLMSEYNDGNEVIFAAYNDDDFEYFQISTILHSTQWFLGGFGEDVTAVMRMNIDFNVSTDAEQLDESSITLFPNPTVDVVNININLEEASEAQIIMTDVNGGLVKFREFSNIKSENVQLNVTDVAAGTYMVHLNTPNGITTKKVVIAQ